MVDWIPSFLKWLFLFFFGWLFPGIRPQASSDGEEEDACLLGSQDAVQDFDRSDGAQHSNLYCFLAASESHVIESEHTKSNSVLEPTVGDEVSVEGGMCAAGYVSRGEDYSSLLLGTMIDESRTVPEEELSELTPMNVTIPAREEDVLSVLEEGTTMRDFHVVTFDERCQPDPASTGDTKKTCWFKSRGEIFDFLSGRPNSHFSSQKKE